MYKWTMYNILLFKGVPSDCLNVLNQILTRQD